MHQQSDDYFGPDQYQLCIITLRYLWPASCFCGKREVVPPAANESMIGLIIIMPSPTAAITNVVKKTRKENAPYMVSSGLQKADNTRNKISNGNITITTKARLYILALNPLLIARVTTLKHDKKKNKVYQTPKAPNMMQLIRGYVHITISTPKLFLKTTELR
jgi:hypothetical protein